MGVLASRLGAGHLRARDPRCLTGIPRLGDCFISSRDLVAYDLLGELIAGLRHMMMMMMMMITAKFKTVTAYAYLIVAPWGATN